LPHYLNSLYFSCTRKDGSYQTLLFTAKASVQNTTQGASQDPGLVKDLGTTKGRSSPGLLANPAIVAPETTQGKCPLPQGHKKLTPEEEHMDWGRTEKAAWQAVMQRQ
jgi:hypothetical protein